MPKVREKLCEGIAAVRPLRRESGPISKPRHPSPLEIGAQLDGTGPNERRLHRPAHVAAVGVSSLRGRANGSIVLSDSRVLCSWSNPLAGQVGVLTE